MKAENWTPFIRRIPRWLFGGFLRGAGYVAGRELMEWAI